MGQCICPPGPPGEIGPRGERGPAGGLAAYSDFYAIMPPDNSETVSPGQDIQFPQDGTYYGNNISRISETEFNLGDVGIYQVYFQVSVSEAGQLVLTLNGEELDYTVAGRGADSSQIIGSAIIETVDPDSVLTLRNPENSGTDLTITPNAGGSEPVSAHLIISRIGPPGPSASNSYEIYVQAGAVDGDGSRDNPYGTIQEGVAAVLPTGTVHILGGVYPVTSTININKAGVTIKGYPSTVIELQEQVVAFMVTGSGITIDGLTFTSDDPYAAAFIEIGGTNHKIINNKIYGPPQSGDSIGWVTNRGFVTQISNMTNLTVQNNIFYNLRQPAYLNPNTSGHILNNVVYNTRGFVVDRAIFVFSGNSWGVPQNATDIALLEGTISGPPYDPITELSANNNSASIEDQRP